MSYIPPNPNGQATKANSAPMVIASDDDIQAKLGIVTETAPGTDTASSGLNGRLQRACQRLTSLIALLPAAFTAGGGVKVGLVDALPAGEAQLGFVGQTIQSMVVEFTRAANTTAYVAGDQINNATTPFLTFTNICRVNAGSIELIGIEVVTDLKSITPKIRVGFYNTDTATLSADLDPARELYADDSKRLGYFDMPALATGADATNSTCSRAFMKVNGHALIAAAASRTLYADMKTLDAFTPASGQKISVKLTYIVN